MTEVGGVRRQLIRLTFEDGQVIVTPKDKSIFFIGAEKATEACREFVRREERVEVFENEVLVPLHDWCVKHEEIVKACYLPIPAAHIQVFIVTNQPAFDFELAEEIAELELNISKAGWRVGITQLPDADDGSLGTFFNPEGALEVYAERGPTPS